MTTAGAIALLVVGAILKFAVTTTSAVYGVNLQIVGVILMLGGVVALLLPLLAYVGSRSGRPGDRDRRDDDDEGRPQFNRSEGYPTPVDPDGRRRQTRQGGE